MTGINQPVVVGVRRLKRWGIIKKMNTLDSGAVSGVGMGRNEAGEEA
jgi:hypothetical protein